MGQSTANTDVARRCSDILAVDFGEEDSLGLLRCFACPIIVAEPFLFTLLLMFMSVFIEVVQIPPTHYWLCEREEDGWKV
jgi:hypothetical protein